MSSASGATSSWPQTVSFTGFGGGGGSSVDTARSFSSGGDFGKKGAESKKHEQSDEECDSQPSKRSKTPNKLFATNDDGDWGKLDV